MTLTLHPAPGYGKQEPTCYCFHLAVSVVYFSDTDQSEPIHDRFQVDYTWEKNVCNQGQKGTKIFTRDEYTNGPTIWQSLLGISMATSYTVIRSQRRLLLGALVNVRRDAHGSMQTETNCERHRGKSSLLQSGHWEGQCTAAPRGSPRSVKSTDYEQMGDLLQLQD